jgi:hypothetical protein
MNRLETISGTVKDLKVVNKFADASSEPETDMEFFTCKVDDTVLFGRFHKVQFANGETVDFVVEKISEGASVHAARGTTMRILWMLPYQTRGHIAQRRSDIQWSVILSLSAVVAVAVSEYFFARTNPNEPAIYALLFYLAVFALVLIVNLMIRRRFASFARHATDVFQQLGYANPAEVDLHVIHKHAQRKLHTESGCLPALMQPWSFRY